MTAKTKKTLKLFLHTRGSKLDEDTKKRLETDPDFILAGRFDFSLRKMLDKRITGGISNRTIAHALGIPESEVETRFDEIILKLKRIVKPGK